ncbi:hypothetical protein ABIA33_004749 [Streptacidiphilus sp. MAP12-16]|jgi:hypothetical protein|uniref:hypothetical protein n=1 Tax=Streptacidiphilus sp. MAP12-16 TaxID=3156300 RepID=UPI0035112520
MDLARAPYEFAGAAADEIRALNYRTLDGGYPSPGDVYDTAHALRTLAQRLPQALEQLGIGLAALADGDQVRITSGAPGTDTVPERRRQIAEALDAGLRATDVLEQALAVVTRLTSDLV